MRTVAALARCFFPILAAATALAAAADPSRIAVVTSRGESPLVVYPPAVSEEPPARPAPLVLLVSGEGGWRRFDDRLASDLAEAGAWVGGIDALKYFWSPQDDRQALATDMRAFAAALRTAVGREVDAPVILGGYSFGADLAPWIAGARGWSGAIRGLILIAPDRTGSLEARFTEMLGFRPTRHTFSVAEALRDTAGTPTVFIHGADDEDSAAPALAAHSGGPNRLLVVSGSDHHFNGHDGELRTALAAGLDWLGSFVTREAPRGGSP